MKERPILFSGPMVNAILAGTKTQTRRVVRPKVVPVVEECFRVNGKWCNHTFDYDLVDLSPYGKPGDRLWVRETWAPNHRAPAGAQDRTPYVLHRANGDGDPGQKWRPSIFMRRYASRITLEITNVRVERLQSITEADATAEGVTHKCDDPINCPACKGTPHKHAFRWLWDEINGLRAWTANPWVWVIGFRRVQP